MDKCIQLLSRAIKVSYKCLSVLLYMFVIIITDNSVNINIITAARMSEQYEIIISTLYITFCLLLSTLICICGCYIYYCRRS